jgi:hypothetical protein
LYFGRIINQLFSSKRRANMKARKWIILSGVLWAVCLNSSAALGYTVNKAVPLLQSVDENKVMEMAMEECRKLGYDQKQVEGKIVFQIVYVGKYQFPVEMVYQITLSIPEGEKGQKSLRLDGEYIGRGYALNYHRNLDIDVATIERNVKLFVEAR